MTSIFCVLLSMLHHIDCNGWMIVVKWKWLNRLWFHFRLGNMLMKFCVTWYQCKQVTSCWGDHGNMIGRQFMMGFKIWCEPRDHVVMQPTIKIEIRSRKAEIGLIKVWHNGNLPQGTNTIGMSRMMPRSKSIFDKSNSIRSRTEEWKNHSHTLKLKIQIKAAEI